MPPTLPPAERYLSRHVWHEGHDHGLATVAIDADGSVTIVPFTRETAGTVFIDGSLHIVPGPDGRPTLVARS